MMTYFKKVLQIIILMLVPLLAASHASAAYFDDANCDTGAIEGDDNSGSQTGNKRSCGGTNIGLETFELHVCHKPLGFLGESCRWIRIGDQKFIGLTGFTVKLEGDKACVYMAPIGLLNIRVNKHEDFTASDLVVQWKDDGTEVAATESGEVADDELGMPSHCVYAPEPRNELKPPKWGNLISKTCSRYCEIDGFDTNQDGTIDPDDPQEKIKWCVSKAKIPFTSVIVQCVEDTMTNIMFEGKTPEGDTFFVAMQSQLRDATRALLALYIIIFGLNYILRKQVISHSEAAWMLMKIALVFYFAAGPGMVDLMPKLNNMSKGFSMLVLEATFGTSVDAAQAQTDLNNAKIAYELARREFLIARAAHQTTVTISNPNGSVTTLNDMNNKERIMNEAKNLYDRALNITLTYGYDYCDYRVFDYSNFQDIDFNQDPPALRTRDMTSARLWDMVDCKLAKYLGIGDNIADASTPQVLLIAVASIFSSLFGIVIFILTIVYLIFIMLISIRIIHIYLMAFIGLMILIYMSPLIIPAALFQYTKKTFDNWLKQIISYVMQPMIMFAFLALLFAMFDYMMFGKNHHFYPLDWGDVASAEYNAAYPEFSGDPAKKKRKAIQDRNKIILDSNGECPDKDAIGCIYQKQTFASTDDDGFGKGVEFTTVNMSIQEGASVVLSLLKL